MDEEDLDEGKEASAVSVGRPAAAANIDHTSPRVGVPAAAAANVVCDLSDDDLLSHQIHVSSVLSDDRQKLRRQVKQMKAMETARDEEIAELKRQHATDQAEISRLKAENSRLKEAFDPGVDASAAALQANKVAAGQKRNAAPERKEHKRRRTQQQQQQHEGAAASIDAQQPSALLVNAAPAAAASEAAPCESCHNVRLPLFLCSTCGHRLCFTCASQIPMAGSPCPACAQRVSEVVQGGTRQS
jgi:hypothetical protein